MTHRYATIIVLCFALIAGAITPVLAQSGVQVDYHISHQRPADQDKPEVTFRSHQSLRDVAITFTRGGDHRLVETFERLDASHPATVAIDQPLGRFSYDVTLEGTSADGHQINLTFRFDIAVVEPLQVEVLRDHIDFDEGLIPLRVSKPIEAIALAVYDRDGAQTVDKTLSFDGSAQTVEVRWSPTGSVGGVRMHITDGEGQFYEQILRPIWIDVPARIVTFETGRADLTDQGIATLEATRRTIDHSLADVDDHRRGDMRLYIAGYTDTVGPASRNLTLSRDRARAIGRWFRDHGVQIPIFTQGFGQQVLAVDTPDNTAEEQNRRALFILGNAPPRQSADIPENHWRPLD